MQKTGMNMERVRQQNRALILNYINDHGPSSRKDIAYATGLTQASVTQITTALISEGILREGDVVKESEKAVGRRKVLLHIEEEAFLVIAINSEPDFTTVAVCDLMGSAVNDNDGNPLIHQFMTQKDLPPKEFLVHIADICKELKEQIPAIVKGKVECISYATTGIVDRVNGISKQAYGIWNEAVPVREILEAELKLPVLLENNVDALAIAELYFGTGRIHDDLLVIKWGPGVGSSVIIDGQVYHGRHGKTAEMGHVIVDPKGKVCVCGRRGCLETLVSEKELKKKEKTGDKFTAIDQFSRAVVNSATILAPRKIVLFGRMAQDEQLRSALIKDCAIYDPAYDENRIVHTSLYEKEHYIGPAAVYTQHKFLG